MSLINSNKNEPKAKYGPGKLVVGPGVTMKGTIEGSDEVFVEGKVDATLASDHLVVGVEGQLSGNIKVGEAEVHGSFEGDLNVSETLKIYESGKVSGTVTYKQLEIKMGGQINGDVKPESGLTVVSENEKGTKKG